MNASHNAIFEMSSDLQLVSTSASAAVHGAGTAV